MMFWLWNNNLPAALVQVRAAWASILIQLHADSQMPLSSAFVHCCFYRC